MNKHQLASLLAELLADAPMGFVTSVEPFRKWLSTYHEDDMLTIDDLTFDDIYPPAALQQQWGYKSSKTANPSDYMRHRIADWCARQGALRMFNAMRNADSRIARGER